MNDYAETYNVGISYYDDNVIATREAFKYSNTTTTKTEGCDCNAQAK